MNNTKHPTLSTGKICYIEIPAVDVLLSASFYKKVFGWNIREHKNGQIAFDDSVNEVSGTWIPGRLPSAEPGVMIYIMVDSVVSTMKTIVLQGGKIVQDIGADEPEITARFSDPAGNIFGLYQEPVKK